MGVGRVGGGGKKGAAGAAKGAGKASGAGFSSKVGRTEAVEGASGVVGNAGVQSVDPLTSQALEISRQLRSGQIKSKEEATKKLVEEVLREKVRMQSRALTEKIADTLQDDPRLTQALERLWAKEE